MFGLEPETTYLEHHHLPATQNYLWHILTPISRLKAHCEKCSSQKMELVKLYTKTLQSKVFVQCTKIPLWLVKGKFT